MKNRRNYLRLHHTIFIIIIIIIEIAWNANCFYSILEIMLPDIKNFLQLAKKFPLTKQQFKLQENSQ